MMNSKCKLPTSATLVAAAAFCLAATAAQAASGYTVTQDQEGLVRQGMNVADVQATLGHPFQQMQYRNKPGPTLAYRVTDSDMTVFEVNFNADGKVASAGERMDPLQR